jgi:SAM-dependent methyltransferase
MRSTSLHWFTCDKGTFLYKAIVRMLYYPFNIYNNRKPLLEIDPELKIDTFVPLHLESFLPLTQPGSSPSRKWCDLFMMGLPWNNIRDDLKTIRMFDIGCGTGNIYSKFNSWSKNGVSRYTGIDISGHPKRLDNQSEHLRFITYDGTHLYNEIPDDTNFIFSQSAVEHIQEDITIFEQIKRFCENANHPVYQLHFIPGKTSLGLYRFHGVRQYTPRTVSKLTRLFPSTYEKKLYILGGNNSNMVHHHYITKKDIRTDSKEAYEQDCLEAFNKDIHSVTLPEKANFYALMIIKK